jgi:regulator of nonsense transcripts 1
MDLVSKLLRDPQFLQTNGKDPGSILIMSPYKQAFQEYRKAIKELKKNSPDLEKRIVDVEPRTIGTAQGHEADFVILDLVRDR